MAAESDRNPKGADRNCFKYDTYYFEPEQLACLDDVGKMIWPSEIVYLPTERIGISG